MILGPQGFVGPGGAPPTAHSGLTGLGADDHTQYALLAGRAGSQTLIFGTGAGEDGTLQATSNATPGDLVFKTNGSTTPLRLYGTDSNLVLDPSQNAALFPTIDILTVRKDVAGPTQIRLRNETSTGRAGLAVDGNSRGVEYAQSNSAEVTSAPITAGQAYIRTALTEGFIVVTQDDGEPIEIAPDREIDAGWTADERRYFLEPRTPASLSANQNDYNPGDHTRVRLQTDTLGARTITGIVAPTTSRDTVMIITNVGTVDTITLAHQSVSSALANRIISPTGADFVISPNHNSVTLIYGNSESRWMFLGNT